MGACKQLAHDLALAGVRNWEEGIPMTPDQFNAVCVMGLDLSQMHEQRPCGDPAAVCRTCPKCVEEGSLL